MPTYDTFENQVNVILAEATPSAIAEPLNAAQRAMHSMTGSPLFSGPGLASNKYDPEKNYYPNLRKGWGKIFNIGEADQMDAASQAVIKHIDDLKNQEPPQKSDMFSPTYITDTEKKMKAVVAHMASIAKSLPGGDQVEKTLARLQGVDISLIDQAELVSIKDDIENWISYIESIVS